MAKIYGLFGAMTGKVADVVMSVRYGEQIARKYQPVVSNPGTQAQVAQRAKLKLMSQVAAVMAPVIAIPRVGAVSSRNAFVKTNFKETQYSNNAATIQLTSIQLTKSVVAFPEIFASRGTNNINASLTTTGLVLDVDRVIYTLFEVQSDDKLRYIASETATSPGTNSSWDVELPNTNNRFLVLAYGVRDNNDFARVTFGNTDVPTAERVARLITSRTLTEQDVTITETRGYLSAIQV